MHIKHEINQHFFSYLQENPVEEEINKILADTVPSQVVKPRPG